MGPSEAQKWVRDYLGTGAVGEIEIPTVAASMAKEHGHACMGQFGSCSGAWAPDCPAAGSRERLEGESDADDVAAAEGGHAIDLPLAWLEDVLESDRGERRQVATATRIGREDGVRSPAHPCAGAHGRVVTEGDMHGCA